MATNAAIKTDPQAVVACTVSRDVQNFDLLIEDMEGLMGERWGDLGFEDALAFLGQPEAHFLEFIAIALDQEDEDDLSLVIQVINAAKLRGIKAIIIAEDVSPAALHKLLREGGDEFIPYPLPEHELAKAIERLRKVTEEPPVQEKHANKLKPTGDRSGVIIPIQGLAGGTGSSNFAVNLAWELANIDKDDPPRVCILDLDLQSGSISTYLDLPRREAVMELLADTDSMDNESFMQALLSFNQKLYVLTAPTDLVPLDVLTPADVGKLIATAQANFDYVIIDMPKVMVEWTETVLSAAHIYFAMLELDMRSAQNALRLKRALQGEELPFEKLRFILNRAPKFTDLSGKARVKRMGESLGISIEVQFPDGGPQVTQANDHGVPLMENLAKSPLRKAIAALAKSVHDVNATEVAKAGR